MAAMFGWVLVWLAGTAAVAGYSITRHAPAIERLMRDDVQAAIAPLAARTDATAIDVVVRDHVATLSGTVDDAAARDALVAAAGGGLGIRHVVDRLDVSTPSIASEAGPSSDGTVPEPPVEEQVAATTEPSADEGATDARDPVADDELVMDTPPAEAPEADDAPGTGLASDDVPPEGEFDTDDTIEEALAADELPSGETFDTEDTSEEALAVENDPTDVADADPIDADATGPSPTLRLDVVDRVLTIEGALSKDDDAAALVLMAMDSFELDYVSNTLESSSNVPTAEWLAPLADLLPALAVLDDPGVDVADRQVTLYGTAPDAATRDAIVARALETLGDYSLVERLDVGGEMAGTDTGTEAAAAADTMAASDVPAETGDAANDDVSPNEEAPAETDGTNPSSERETIVTDEKDPDRRGTDTPVADAPAATEADVADEVVPAMTLSGDTVSDEASLDETVSTDVVPSEETDETLSADAVPSEETDEALSAEAVPGEETDEALSAEAVPGEETDEALSADAVPSEETDETASVEATPDATPAEETTDEETTDGTPASSAPEAIESVTADAGTDADPIETATDDTAPIETARLESGRDVPEAPRASSPELASPVAALRAALAALPDGRILFESGSARLTEDSLVAVDAIAETLLAHPGVPVAIEGHTDGIGFRERNLDLSQRRAGAVRDRLVERGVPFGRLTPYGYGEGVPIADNATAEGRAANRRIEFTF